MMDLGLLNDAIFRKALDADFHNVMKGVGFILTPREYLTLHDMQRYHESQIKDMLYNSTYGIYSGGESID